MVAFLGFKRRLLCGWEGKDKQLGWRLSPQRDPMPGAAAGKPAPSCSTAVTIVPAGLDCTLKLAPRRSAPRS